MVIDTLPQLFACSIGWGRREALRAVGGFRSRQLSYRDLSRLVLSTACGLRAVGVARGDRLILWGANSPEWVAAFWAAQQLGLPVIPIDPGYSAEFVERVRAETGARILAHDRDVHPGICPCEAELSELAAGPPRPVDFPQISPDDIAEIVFTSGTTKAPRGVVLRHRQICSNLAAMAPDFERYRGWARPLQPIRIFNLLPLGHMFGQAMSLFIPILLGGAAVLTSRTLQPGETVNLIRQQRVSVLVGVPRMLQQLREYLERSGLAPGIETSRTGIPGVLERWVRYRRLHQALGWKFWALVVGGATVSRKEEEFWARVGILLIQGYGLTEASPVVSLNHPLSTRRGSLGRVLRGQEIKLAADGEILVRGSSISTEYVGIGRSTEDGWLHTGDLGEFDTEGRLYFRGRKEEVIVTAEGTNVFPDEVEAALEAQPGIAAACVVGLDSGQGETVHAVLISPESPGRISELVGRANSGLEPHQRVQGWTLWPEPDFPRTSSTLKVRRLLVRNTLLSGAGSGTAKSGVEDPLSELTRSFLQSSDRAQDLDRRLDELGITSLDRVDLLTRLEAGTGVPLDEAEFSRLQTVGEVREWLSTRSERPDIPARRLPMPNWPRRLPWRWIRRAAHRCFRGLIRRQLNPQVAGLEHLAVCRSPVILSANHTSHLDTPLLLASLPAGWGERVVPAVRLEYFAGRFFPSQVRFRDRLRDRGLYFLACLLFQVVPLPQHGTGLSEALQFCEELAARGYSILIFPEGERSTGELGVFKPGAVRLARRLGLPLLPVYLEGSGHVLPPGRWRPRRSPVRVWFGPEYPAPVEPPLPEAAAEFERHYRMWISTLEL